MQSLIETPRRILIIDDNPSIHDDYRKILGQRKSAETGSAAASFFGDEAVEEALPAVDILLDSAFQGEEALSKVQDAIRRQQPYSMAFVDMRMPPGWDGLRTVEELWKVQPDLQIVICTAYSDNTWDDICRRLGQTDQLLILKKPFDNIEVAQLAIALTEKWVLTRNARLRQRDLERMVEERTAELERAALHDPLTGLSNRTRFNERLDHAIKCIARTNESAAVLVIDLDGFKGVNDSLGHPAGDELIRGVARRLESNVRETDCVARLGGDEFAILQSPIRDGSDVSVLVERLFRVLEEPFDIEGNRVQVGMSCGIAVAPQDGNSASELLKQADLALYRAKGDGRSCYRFFKEEMDQRVKERRRLAGEIQEAIDERQFELFYQPLMAAGSSRVVCYEALLRWNHPKRGLLSPCDFLAVAEDTGLTAPIGTWVIQQACRDATLMPGDVSVAVNVSALQFRRNGLLTTIYDSLAETGLAPSRLELEIVESVVLRDSNAVVHALDQLHSLGVKIAMDDFGTGYSSLSYLRMFPFDKIKLDRSFVQDAPNCADALAIIRAVAMLGRCLGLELTAEGVETVDQLDCVVAEGYDRVQGFYYARPMPLSRVLQPATS